jgi:hypothetical protein
MEKLRGPVQKARSSGLALNRFAAYAYKPKKKEVSVPFGLETKTSPLLNEILEADASLSESVKGLMSQAKAAGTMVNYDGMTKKFARFCAEKGYVYPDFTEKAALHFVIQMDKDGATMSSLCQVKPALALVEQLAGKKVSSFSKTVDTMLTAAKRRAAESKPIVQKAGKLPDDTLQRLYPVHYLPHLEGDKTADPVMLRTFVRTIVVYFTFCRFSCYSRLRAMDFEDYGDSILITFPFAKNDQFHQGNATCLVSNGTDLDPVKIVREYFRLCGFRFGAANGDMSKPNCVMRKLKKGWRADGTRGVSYTTGTNNLRAMMAKVGIHVARLSDKSVKSLAVTKAMRKGMTTGSAREHGRWKTEAMPLHYKTSSLEHKEDLARMIPI